MAHSTAVPLGHAVWSFARHFFEMCLAMCLVGGALNSLVFVAGPAVLGYPDLRDSAPRLALAVIAAIYTAPMTLWMRLRGMEWRPVAEMSGAVVGLAVVVIALAATGPVADNTVRSLALGFCGPACVVMLPVMLLRLDLYAAHPGHQVRPATTPQAG